ncbi:MAG: hypothetical protein H0W12_03050 [Chitinophagaceae bacterium]|nr:hypothetical protein [Chitinophagaceae bacterium]
MSLETIFYITQIVAAVAVIITLFYVAYEVRHNTKALKLSTYQAVVNSSTEILHSLYTNTETASFYHRCLFNNAELNGPEKLRWHAVMIAVYRHWDNLLYQNRMGSLEDEMWLTYDRTMTHYFSYKAWVDWFTTNSHF